MQIQEFLEKTEKVICENCYHYTKSTARDTRLINFILDKVGEKIKETYDTKRYLEDEENILELINQLRIK